MDLEAKKTALRTIPYGLYVLTAEDRNGRSIFVGEVVDAGVVKPPKGRPDEITLTLSDLGAKIFYGG
ncbi:MAG: hypothetical protein PVJ64_05445 [Gemmatimonadales bacterium]|jgi:hypothetical protein